MNNGKICVSVCAETTGELVKQIKQAAIYADIIELRFDCLDKNIIRNVMENILRIDKQFLVTFRPKEQGGKRELNFRERLKFWEFFLWNNKAKKLYADIEFDLQLILKLESNKIIVSSHDFSGLSGNSTATYEILTIINSDFLKIAVNANDIIDSTAVWKLLERAKKENKKLIPIAMGEAGKWTRILGLAHGAFMTYASLESGKETASGQISAQDLIETYRVKELNEQTEVYGIVGNPVAHSLSPFMHNAAFKFHNLNAVYIPFEVKNLDEFVAKFIREETREIDLNFRGFSVTIPHKEAIIEHLDEIDEAAKAIGAVNTVKIENGKLYGFNTDAEGFIEPLRNSYGDLKDSRVAILGAGGAARACIYALKKENAKVTIFARNVEKAKGLADEFKVQSSKLKAQSESFAEFDILVNTTPLGTNGEFENETPAFASQIENVKLVYDLIYNPVETPFIKAARKATVPTIGGLAMLVEQGMKQFEIWTSKDAPMKEMSAAALRKLK
jgi:3-dehydroquinate dehydratase/shikimate dehydrogenase